MDTLAHVGLSNALAATILAVLAAGVAYFSRRPALIHSLWLLVLLRLLVPPFFPVPIPCPNLAAVANAEAGAVSLPAEPVAEPLMDPPEAPARVIRGHAAEDLPIAKSGQAPRDQPEHVLAASGPTIPPVLPLAFFRHMLFAFWLTGSVLWLLLACWRFHRFGMLLRYARLATPSQQERVRLLAARLGLRRCPNVWLVPAVVSPMLGALVGAPRLFVPAALWHSLSEEQRDTLLVHELAHLRRRDHWIRRLEFVATVIYWWHPILWWARREIQEAEEQCCDAWVVSLSPAVIPAYAEALVATVTFLSQSRPALPLGASGMGHAHLLRRRLTMIMRGTTPKGLSAAGFVAVLVLGAVALPLLPTRAQTTAAQAQEENTGGSPDAGNAQEQGSGAAVQAGGITRELVKTGNQELQTRERHPAVEQLEEVWDQVELLQAQLQVQYAERSGAKARYEQAQRHLEKQEHLYGAGARPATTKEELDQARTEVEVQKARLQAKEAQVKEVEVRLRQAKRWLAELGDQQKRPGTNIPFAELMRALKENKTIREKNSEIARMEEHLAKAEVEFSDKNHLMLQRMRERIRKAKDELKDLEKKLIPSIRNELAEYYELFGEPAPLVAKGAPGLKPGEKQLQLQARSMPWKETLDWLAMRTGIAVIAGVMPEGNFNVFGSNRTYTIPEVVDLINGQLKTNKKPCLLIRGKHDFQLIPYERNRPTDLTNLPRVTAKELDQHGDTELVILELPLKTLVADEVARELTQGGRTAEKLLGPLGTVMAIPGSNHLVLRDTVQTLKNIVKILQNAEDAEKKSGIFRHKCIYVKAKEAEKLLKELLGVAPPAGAMPGQPGQPMPAPPPGIQAAAAAAQKKSVHVGADEASNTVFVSGPPDKIDLAKQAVAELDVAKPGQPPVVTGPPILRTYSVPGGNAPDVAKALKEMYQSRNVTVSSVGIDSIIVWALPEDQEAIARYIQSSKDKTEFQVIPLYTLEAKKAIKNLQELFDVHKGPAPTLDIDPSSNMIMVRGTPEQVAAVKEALKKLGEDNKPGRANPPRGPMSPGPGATPRTGDRLKQLEDKLDTLLREVEALRRQSRTESQREGRPR